jgi:TPR repeat protein
VSKKEEVVELDDEDELRANLPAFGATFVSSLGADLKRGASLDVSMVLVGKRRTTVRHAARDVLRGGAACEGATHFVRGAFVGAFTLSLGSRGKVGVSAGVVGSASSESSKLDRYRDGQPETCGQAHAGAEQPLDTCSALVRLEVVALDAPAAAPETGRAVVVEAACPSGLVRSGGKCTAPTAWATHVCAVGDAQDCTEQCTRGQPDSCNNLGAMYAQGKGVPRDERRAPALYKQACDGGLLMACNNLATAYFYGEGVAMDRDHSAAIYETTCNAGYPQSCAGLALAYSNGWGKPRDKVHAFALYDEACQGGLSDSCTGVAGAYAYGEGVPKDEARAIGLYKRACDGGEAQACGNLGLMYEHGRGAAANRELAVRFYAEGCKLGGNSWTSCVGDVCKTGPMWSCAEASRLRGQP